MFYMVAPLHEFLGSDSKERYVSIFVADDITKAEDYAKRKAAKTFGTTEQAIFKQVGTTVTAMPTEVIVTLNGE